MKLTREKWNQYTGGYVREWIADTEEDLTADFDPGSVTGSTVYVISTKNVYMKNSKNQWQKVGTTEVIV